MPALPTYRLQTLLEIRERAKEAAEAGLARAIAAKKVEEDKLRALELDLERLVASRHEYRRAYMEKAMQGDLAVSGAVNVNQYIEHLKTREKLKQENIVDQKEVVAAREEDVVAARAELVKKTQELRALEKHREKWLAEVKKELAQKEELQMDELAQNIFFRNDR